MRHSIVSFATLAICGFLAFGQEKEMSVQDVTDRMQKRFEKIENATASFTQKVKFGFSQIEQQFSGTIAMKKPGKYRIESEHQTIVTDGQTVWAYSPVNRQVVIDRYRENQNSVSPERFLINLPENYFVTLLGRERDKGIALIVLKLVPKDDRSFVNSVKVWVEDGTWIVHRISILDANETETTYHLSDFQINTKINDSRFAFTPPAGTEIVDLR